MSRLGINAVSTFTDKCGFDDLCMQNQIYFDAICNPIDCTQCKNKKQLKLLFKKILYTHYEKYCIKKKKRTGQYIGEAREYTGGLEESKDQI